MHEISIAGAIIDIAIDTAKKHNARKVKELTLEIGELTSLNPDQLKFIFSIISKGTVLEGADFVIKIISPVIRCNKCEYQGPIEYFEKVHFLLPMIKCPRCEETDIEILSGKECNVKNMKII